MLFLLFRILGGPGSIPAVGFFGKRAVSRWNSTLPVAPGRAGFHPGPWGCCKLGVSRWNSTFRSRLGGPGSIPAMGFAASTLCRGGTRHSGRAWEGRVPSRPWRLLPARCVEVELDTPGRAWEGRVPSRPWGLRQARCVEVELDTPGRASEGRVPSRPWGLRQARCVEVELDTPGRAWEGRVPFRPWRGCCKLAVSRWNSTFPVAPGRAGFHPGHGVCGKLAVSRWNSTGSRSTLLVALDIPGLRLHSSADPRAIVPPQHLADPLSGPHQLFNIHPGIDPHTIKHIKHILAGHVTAGARGVRAAAQPGDRAVEHADPFQQGSVDIAQGLAVGVVEMSGQLFAGHPSADCLDQLPGSAGHADPDGVAEGYFVTAHRQ